MNKRTEARMRAIAQDVVDADVKKRAVSFTDAMSKGMQDVQHAVDANRAKPLDDAIARIEAASEFTPKQLAERDWGRSTAIRSALLVVHLAAAQLDDAVQDLQDAGDGELWELAARRVLILHGRLAAEWSMLRATGCFASIEKAAE